MLIDFNVYDWLIGVGILVVLLPVLWWRKRNLSYLLFFSVFWIYLLAVVQAIFFPFVINTNDTGGIFRPSINLIPFYFGSCFDMPSLCMKGIFENIILTLPFGFGINFLTRVKSRNVLWVSIAIGLGFEFSQLVISLVFRSGFRASDINDAIFNTIGVLLGYALFRIFAWLYFMASAHYKIKHKWLFADIYDVVSQTQVSGKSKIF